MFLSCLVIYCTDYVILLTELLVFNSNCEKINIVIVIVMLNIVQ